MATVESVVALLRAHATEANVLGKLRFGITVTTGKILGVNAPEMRQVAKEVGQNHLLAVDLWNTNVLEARHVSFMISDPAQLTDELLDRWVDQIESWDLVDGLTFHLAKTIRPYHKIPLWAQSDKEFVKRSAFSLIAGLAVHDKTEEGGQKLLAFMPLIIEASDDERNFVRKAVNWALRQIGKRGKLFHAEAIKVANIIAQKESKAAKWIAADALRELQSSAVKSRVLRGKR